ncbi:phosphate ABC transporter substrate-binding protein PstS [Tolumonas lignilytica]|jgi:phosphate ABC transporter, phosphate-binding protein|uniref:phosphate ABC transporter substrate-binding protein PstS n=1 Tax=Tolumonas lignilytica TaxID=1283284 RepID=UPI0004639049|nr:phosphate ABC transporter substrate-binding protein PstS [Tolumonas lignilytica]
MKMTLKTLVVSMAIASSATAAYASDVTGAGSSFAAPLYSKWADAYNKESGTRMNYQSIGSGAGIKQIIAKTVDFGASDMPLTDDQLAKDGLVQWPTAVGGIVPVIKIDGVAADQLKLTGSVLADIFDGKITKWSDPAIVKLNSGLKLPDIQISVVHRADASGTTFGFSNYLSKVNPEWAEKYKFGTTVNWAVGVGGKGNEGVSAFVQRLAGSIGYVETAYAKSNHMTTVELQNADGNFVAATPASVKAAAAGADWSKSFYQILTNQPGKDSWPITSGTFVLVHRTADKAEQTEAVLKFFDFGLSKGDKLAEELQYVPMPESVKEQIRKEWTTIKGADGQALWKK